MNRSRVTTINAFNICVCKNQKPNAMAIYCNVINVLTAESRTRTQSTHLIISSARKKNENKKTQKRNNAHIEVTTHTNLIVQRSGNASHLLCAIRLSLGKAKAKKINATNRKTGFTISLHSPSNVDVQLYFGLVLSRHAIYASSVCPYPARIVIRCSVFVHQPAGAHTARRKWLLCITAASSGSAYDAICAVHFELRFIFVSSWFFHLALELKQSATKKTK